MHEARDESQTTNSNDHEQNVVALVVQTVEERNSGKRFARRIKDIEQKVREWNEETLEENIITGGACFYRWEQRKDSQCHKEDTKDCECKPFDFPEDLVKGFRLGSNRFHQVLGGGFRFLV